MVGKQGVVQGAKCRAPRSGEWSSLITIPFINGIDDVLRYHIRLMPVKTRLVMCENGGCFRQFGYDMVEKLFVGETNRYGSLSGVLGSGSGLGSAAGYYSHLVDNSDKPVTKFSVASKYDLDNEQKAADEIYDWTGSEKQIAWAKKIRDTKIKQIKNFLLGAEAEYKP